MRVAIVSTPRSGNTWVRHVLRDLIGSEEIAVHNPRDLPPTFGQNIVLQLHWYREPQFQQILQENGFRIVVLARHPLDVLISVLHFARHEPLTERWLEGNAEIPCGLADATPTSPAFLRYAESWGAENLLGVSYAWWHDQHAVRLRYEELVRSPMSVFAALARTLGVDQGSIDDAVAANRFDVLRETPNHHGWQGRPGLWRSLMTPDAALRIQRRHHRVFRTLGYRVGPYLLTRRAAARNWARLAIPPGT